MPLYPQLTMPLKKRHAAKNGKINTESPAGKKSRVAATSPGNQTSITAFFAEGSGGKATASSKGKFLTDLKTNPANVIANERVDRPREIEMVELLTSEDEGSREKPEVENVRLPQLDTEDRAVQDQAQAQNLTEAMEDLPDLENTEGNRSSPGDEGIVAPPPASTAPSSPSASALTGSPVDLPCTRYDAVSDACWSEKTPAPYLHLAWAFELLCSTTKRLTKADVLVNTFRSLIALAPSDLLPAVYLSSNKLSSSFQGIDINVGGSTVSAAVVQATGTSSEKLKQLYIELGDLGDVAQALRVRQRMLVPPSPLSIRGVYRTIVDMANMKGQGCEGRKRAMMVRLIRSCRGPEARFLVRTLVQNLRTGATLTSVLSALAMAAVMHHTGKEEGRDAGDGEGKETGKKEATMRKDGGEGEGGRRRKSLELRLKEAQVAVKECYNSCPDIPRIVQALIEGGVEAMQAACSVAVGTPVKPMLAKICSGIPEMMEKYGSQPFTSEYKYDGQRAQIHLLGDRTVKIFNRHIEDMTDKYPDVAQLMHDLQEALRAPSLPPSSSSSASPSPSPWLLKDVILDTELVAVDRAEGNRLLAFQTLATRGRKDVSAEGVRVQVCVFAFDLLFLNGQSYVKEPLSSRRARLYSLFGPLLEGGEGGSEGGFEGRFAFAAHTETNDPEKVQEFFTEALEAGCEGIMCKSLPHEYEPSKRTDSWLKVKRDYVEGLHDTLDLVPIGAWWGNGRKAGWFSPILLACFNPETDELQSLCRCMSGLTDAMYTELTAFYQEEGRLLENPKSYVRTGETCAVWFEPCQVWEVRGAELTLSPVHKAGVGIVDAQRGFSLRFPRFLKIRSDKGVEDATTAGQIAELFRMQVRRVDVDGDDKDGGRKKGGAMNGKEKEEAVEEREEEWEDIL